MEKIEFNRDYFEAEGKVNGLSDYYNKQKKDCKIVADRIEMFLSCDKSKTILEGGCAYGQSISELKARGYAGYGFDISEYAIKEGKSRLNNPDLMAGDIQGRDFVSRIVDTFKKPYFDFVFSCITLEHIMPFSVERVISNLHRLTAPGGMNYHAIDLERGNDDTHYCILTRGKWNQLFAAGGFVPVDVPPEMVKLNWFLFKKT